MADDCSAQPLGVARRRPARRDRRAWTGWGFVGPFLVVFAFALVVPIGYAIYLSLFREQLIGGNTFVGVRELPAGADRPAVLVVGRAGSRSSSPCRCRSC